MAANEVGVRKILVKAESFLICKSAVVAEKHESTKNVIKEGFMLMSFEVCGTSRRHGRLAGKVQKLDDASLPECSGVYISGCVYQDDNFSKTRTRSALRTADPCWLPPAPNQEGNSEEFGGPARFFFWHSCFSLCDPPTSLSTS
jgi:hypothetical protein